MTPERFEIIEHTADIGIRARGRNLAELFENAAAGMFTIMADKDALKASEAVRVSAAASSPDELLAAWLEELLYLSEAREVLFRRVEVREARERLVAGVARGAPLQENRDALRHEIKAVTYHLLEVREDPEGGWTCQAIFDV